jgi:hypothetical protein
MTVVLVSMHRRAISARDESRVTADAGEFEPDDEFDIVAAGSASFGLRTLAGKYLSVQPDGRVQADRAWLRDWEKFRLVPAPEGRFGLFSFHQLFLSAHPNGKLEATSGELREWEQFYLQELPGVDSLAPGMLARSQAQLPFLLTAAAVYDFCQERPAQCAEAALKLVGPGAARLQHTDH